MGFDIIEINLVGLALNWPTGTEFDKIMMNSSLKLQIDISIVSIE